MTSGLCSVELGGLSFFHFLPSFCAPFFGFFLSFMACDII
jgi:hypothetical protein